MKKLLSLFLLGGALLPGVAGCGGSGSDAEPKPVFTTEQNLESLKKKLERRPNEPPPVPRQEKR